MRLFDFGYNMRKYRMSHGLTQNDLAEILGLQPKYISFLENGRRYPSAAVQQKMEDLLMQEEWGKVLVSEDRIMSDEEINIQLILFKKFCKIHPLNRQTALELINQVLDSMARKS